MQESVSAPRENGYRNLLHARRLRADTPSETALSRKGDGAPMFLLMRLVICMVAVLSAKCPRPSQGSVARTVRGRPRRLGTERLGDAGSLCGGAGTKVPDRIGPGPAGCALMGHLAPQPTTPARSIDTSGERMKCCVLSPAS
ncbi:hypothetical protein MRB53_040290 [Persea americana]|nr:hypothetical protein MRB53_040290 [Persea americana]